MSHDPRIPKERRRARAYAAKFRAETVCAEPPTPLEPTDANLAAVLDRCGRPARPEEYDAIRRELAVWDAPEEFDVQAEREAAARLLGVEPMTQEDWDALDRGCPGHASEGAVAVHDEARDIIEPGNLERRITKDSRLALHAREVDPLPPVDLDVHQETTQEERDALREAVLEIARMGRERGVAQPRTLGMEMQRTMLQHLYPQHRVIDPAAAASLASRVSLDSRKANAGRFVLGRAGAEEIAARLGVESLWGPQARLMEQMLERKAMHDILTTVGDARAEQPPGQDERTEPMTKRPTAVYSTWRAVMGGTSLTPDDDVLAFLDGDPEDEYDVPGIVDDYRAAVNALLPGTLLLHGQEFIGETPDEAIPGGWQESLRETVAGIDLGALCEERRNVAAPSE